jgi:hypothetical protein
MEGILLLSGVCCRSEREAFVEFLNGMSCGGLLLGELSGGNWMVLRYSVAAVCSGVHLRPEVFQAFKPPGFLLPPNYSGPSPPVRGFTGRVIQQSYLSLEG